MHKHKKHLIWNNPLMIVSFQVHQYFFQQIIYLTLHQLIVINSNTSQNYLTHFHCQSFLLLFSLL